jgi:hypothetical protein
VHSDNTKRDRNGHRCLNGQIGLKMPMAVVRAKRAPYMRRGKPAAILDRAHDSDFRIVARYQAEFRGIAEYYQLAYNRHRLSLLRYVMERSLTKTLGHKNKISVNKVWNRYRTTWQTAAGPRKACKSRSDGTRGNGHWYPDGVASRWHAEEPRGLFLKTSFRQSGVSVLRNSSTGSCRVNVSSARNGQTSKCITFGV